MTLSVIRGSIVVIFISMLVRWLSTSAPNIKPASFCPIHIQTHRWEENEKDNKWESPSCVFSESYQEARDKFRRAAKAIPGGKLFTLDVLPDVDPGAYTIDLFLLKSEKENAGLAVHSSGTHGVEGYAGSAVQIAYLYELAASSSEELILDSSILLIHSVNPFGMAHFRRYNENNVDLNRNGLSEEEFEIETSRDPNYGEYEDLSKGLLNPSGRPTYWDAYIGFLGNAAYYILFYGFLNVKRTLVTGQYHNPKGIMFGGTKLERSHVLLKDFLIKHDLTGIRQTHEPVVTWVDLHTGLGPSGIDTMLVSNEFKEETERWFTDLPRPFASDDVTGGYELSKGFMNSFYRKLFPKNKSMPPLIITQEFGTIRPVMVARAMILENRAYHYSPLEDHGWWSQFTRDAFYVRSTKWKKSILDRGMTVWKQAIRRSSYKHL